MCSIQHVSQQPRYLQEYKPSARDWLSSYWKGFMSPDQMARIRNTGVPMEFLKEVGCRAAELICCSQLTLESQLGPARALVVGTNAGHAACQLCKVPMTFIPQGRALQRCCAVALPTNSGLRCWLVRPQQQSSETCSAITPAAVAGNTLKVSCLLGRGCQQ